MKPLYTTKEAAKVLGFTDDAYIRRLIAAGKLYAKRAGAGWLVPDYAIEWFKKGKKLRVREGGVCEDERGFYHYFFNMPGSYRDITHSGAYQTKELAEHGLQVMMESTQEQFGKEYKVILIRVKLDK